MRRLLIGIGLVVIILIIAAGSMAGALYYQGHRKPPSDATYVAMGSSFASGPGIGQPVAGSPMLCMRSASNYPRLVAQAEKLVLSDVSCSGATTRHILKGGQYFQPAQIDAVTPQIRLVTVTIGGNDVSYSGSMLAMACANNPKALPFLWRASGVCKFPAQDKTDAAFKTVEANIVQIVTEARRRAPGVRVILVDYISVLPPSGTCPKLGLNKDQADAARDVASRLAAATEAAATASNAGLIRWSAASQTHDVCSADPWVQPYTVDGGPPGHGTVAFHPNQAGMDAAARLITEALMR